MRRVRTNPGYILVGSSLSGSQPHDIDVTLVGLDFRSIFHYGGVFLRIPSSLQRCGVIVPEDHCDAYRGLNTDEDIHINGKTYRYNTSISSSHDFLSTYCDNQIAFTPMIRDIFEKLGAPCPINPLHPYSCNDRGSFLVVQQLIGEKVDFLIHSENLLVNHWKSHQLRLNLPFIEIFEGKNSDISSTQERRFCSCLNYPDFIDPDGSKRSSEVNSS